jgi:hypothetical protein
MEQLFTSQQDRIILKEKELPSTISSHRAMSSLKLSESISTIYALLESNDVTAAEKSFHTIWRSNPSFRLHSDLRNIVCKFITSLLNSQKQQDTLDTSGRQYLDQTLEWFSFLEEIQMKPSPLMFASLLDYLLQSNQIQLAKEWVSKIPSQDVHTVLGISAEKDVLMGLFKAMDIAIDLETTDQILLSVLQDSIHPFEAKSEIVDIKPTDTDGVRILRSALLSKIHSGDNKDKYHEQIWIESRSFKAAQEQYEQQQLKLPESIKNKNIPTDLLEKWFVKLRDRLDAALRDPVQEDLNGILPFLKLFHVDVLARIVVSEVVRIPTSSKHIKDTGYIPALQMAVNLSQTLQKEHNLEYLTSRAKSTLHQRKVFPFH